MVSFSSDTCIPRATLAIWQNGGRGVGGNEKTCSEELKRVGRVKERASQMDIYMKICVRPLSWEDAKVGRISEPPSTLSSPTVQFLLSRRTSNVCVLGLGVGKLRQERGQVGLVTPGTYKIWVPIPYPIRSPEINNIVEAGVYLQTRQKEEWD